MSAVPRTWRRMPVRWLLTEEQRRKERRSQRGGRMSSIRITQERATGEGKVVIDGHDISRALRGISYSVSAGEIPQVELDILIIDMSDIDSDDVVWHIPEATAEALVKLGWTPPKDSP